MTQGCRKILEEGQWWGFCGETDMGQTLPALCTDCGGTYILADPQKTIEQTKDIDKYFYSSVSAQTSPPTEYTVLQKQVRYGTKRHRKKKGKQRYYVMVEWTFTREYHRNYELLVQNRK